LRTKNSEETGLDAVAKTFAERIENMSLTWAAKIVRRGDMIYLALHASDIAFYELHPGDKVLVSISKLKRAKRPGQGDDDDE
jgi:hypothetical protein